MIDNLLVPLDGSSLAESVLPWVRELARATRGAVTLLHIRERNAPSKVHGDRHLDDTGDAERYLAAVAETLGEGIRVEFHVHTVAEGDVAESIAEHAVELGEGLTVICTHGRPGARGMLMGSIGQQVLRKSRYPLLMLRAEAETTLSPRLRNMLVLLSGQPEGEAILTYASELARAHGAGIHLLMVVPTVATIRGDRAAAARVSPLATSAMLEVEQENAVEYLGKVADGLAAQGVSVTAEVARGDVPQVVVDAARGEDVDMVAMASHGRSGFAALWSASVGTEVQSRIEKPMLLMNPAASASAP